MSIAKAIIDKAKEYIKRGREKAFIIILPTQELILETKREILKGDDIKGLVGTNILSFDDFIKGILLKESSYHKIDDVGRQLLLEEILSSLKERGKLKYFTRIVGTPGLTWSLNQLISELKLAAILPKDLLGVSEKLNFGSKEEDLIMVYEEYQKTLSSGKLLDKEERYLLALKLIKENRLALLQGVEEILLSHFIDFTPLQANIFAALGEGVKVTSYDSDLTAQTTSFSEKVKNEEMELQIVKAAGIDREVREVVREIKKLALDGVALRDITLVARDISGYSEILINTFQEMGVPYQIYRRENLGKNPLSKAFLALVEAIAKEEEGFELPKLLKNNYLVVNPEEVKELVALWKDVGLKGKREDWLERLQDAIKQREWVLSKVEAKAKEGTKDEEEFTAQVTALNENLKGLKSGERNLLDFFRLWNYLPKEGTIKEFLAGTKAIIKDLALESNLYKALRDQNLPDLQVLSRDTKALDRLEGILVELEYLAQLVGKEDISLTIEEYYQKLFKALREGTYVSQPQYQGGVKLMAPTQLRGLKVPYLFAVGLTEGSFPRNIKGDWLLKEEQRKALNQEGFQIETVAHLVEKEDLYFNLVLQGVTKRLVLSYPETSEEGELNLPSKYIEDLKKLTGLRDEEIKEIPISEVFPSQWEKVTSNREFRAKAYNDLFHTSEEANTPFIQLLLERNNLRARKSLAAILVEEKRSIGESSEWDGALKASAILAKLEEKYAQDFLFSISSLGDFGQCPFKYFAQAELKVKKLDQVQDELSPLDRGNLCHEILHRFFDKYKGESLKSLDLEFYLTQIEAIAKEVFQKRDFEKLYLHPYFWQLEQRDIMRKLKELIIEEVGRFEKVSNHGGSLKPAYLEWSFGNPEPLILRKEEQEIKFRGKVDRIDIAEDDSKFIVYDYKNNQGATIDEMKKAINIQLPIYILAVKNLLLKDKEALGGAFYSINKGKMDSGQLLAKADAKVYFNAGARAKKGFMEEEEWQAFEEALIEKVFAFVEAIRDGKFLLEPKKCPYTVNFGAYCDYKDICRFEVERFKKGQKQKARENRGEGEEILG